MKIGELAQELKKYNPEMDVVILQDNQYESAKSVLLMDNPDIYNPDKVLLITPVLIVFG